MNQPPTIKKHDLGMLIPIIQAPTLAAVQAPLQQVVLRERAVEWVFRAAKCDIDIKAQFFLSEQGYGLHGSTHEKRFEPPHAGV